MKLKIQNIIFKAKKLLQISVMKFKIQNIIFNVRKLLQISVTKFKIRTLFSMQGITANFSYKIQNHRRYLNVSRNIII